MLTELTNATLVARETASRKRQEMKALKAALKNTLCPSARELIRTALNTAETKARVAADTALRAGVRERAVRNGVIPAFGRYSL